MKPRKNINTIIPSGSYFKPPSNKTFKDKTKYERKQKHGNKGESNSI